MPFEKGWVRSGFIRPWAKRLSKYGLASDTVSGYDLDRCSILVGQEHAEAPLSLNRYSHGSILGGVSDRSSAVMPTFKEKLIRVETIGPLHHGGRTGNLKKEGEQTGGGGGGVPEDCSTAAREH